jgi:hypothetical protein
VATGLFLLQAVHLFWLTSDVVATRLVGQPFWSLDGALLGFVLIVDYTEIPALLGVSLIYLHELRRRFDRRNLLFLLFLNSQWLHIFWITDEFVVTAMTGEVGIGLPGWLAWVAIAIDYLELPVMVDTVAKLLGRLRAGRLAESVAQLDLPE